MVEIGQNVEKNLDTARVTLQNVRRRGVVQFRDLTLLPRSLPTIATLQEANKLLRFLKSNADVAIRVKQTAKNMKDLVFVVLTDAAWAVREDGSSQGGYVILLCHKRVMDNETADYIVFDWRSWKLPRGAAWHQKRKQPPEALTPLSLQSVSGA